MNLLEKADGSGRKMLQDLYYLSLPVTHLAFHIQEYTDELESSLESLKDLTLIQVYFDAETKLLYFFMPPLVKMLLKQSDFIKEQPQEFHEKAGRYHYFIYSHVQDGNINELAASFWHFYRAGNKVHIDEIGQKLAGFYYGRSFYLNSLEICEAVHEIFGEKMPWWCGNRLGMIFLSTGQYDNALPLFKRALHTFDGLNELTEEDLENKGTTLSNMGSISHARGDYETALKYLEDSLTISREIGDKSGEIPTLHNMAMIEFKRKNMEKMFTLEMEAYKIASETGDAMGLFQVGQVLGQLLIDNKQRDEGVKILRLSYEIGCSAGLSGTENVKDILHQIGESI